MLSKVVLAQTTWHVAQESRVPPHSTQALGPSLLAAPPAGKCAACPPPSCNSSCVAAALVATLFLLIRVGAFQRVHCPAAGRGSAGEPPGVGPSGSASQEWKAQRGASAGEGQQGRSSWLTMMQVKSSAWDIAARLATLEGNMEGRLGATLHPRGNRYHLHLACPCKHHSVCPLK